MFRLFFSCNSLVVFSLPLKNYIYNVNFLLFTYHVLMASGSDYGTGKQKIYYYKYINIYILCI